MTDELITVSQGVALLDAQTAVRIAEFERKMKEIKEAEDELKAAILEEMEEKNILKIQTDEMTISFVAGTERETLDSKQLKADHPDLYDSYIKLTPVKPSIRIKLK